MDDSQQETPLKGAVHHEFTLKWVSARSCELIKQRRPADADALLEEWNMLDLMFA